MKEFKRLAKVSPNWEVKKRVKQMIKNGKTDLFMESIGIDIGYSGERAASSGRSRRAWMDNSCAPNLKCRCAQLVADMKCFVALIQAICKGSEFHAAIRRLKIKLTMERISACGDAKDGRRKVPYFLRQRLLPWYPNLTRDERAAIEDDGQQVMKGEGGNTDTEDTPKEKMRVYRA